MSSSRHRKEREKNTSKLRGDDLEKNYIVLKKETQKKRRNIRTRATKKEEIRIFVGGRSDSQPKEKNTERKLSNKGLLFTL